MKNTYLVVGLIIFITSGIYIFTRNDSFTNSNIPKISLTPISNITKCTRNTRQDNAPQYDRALSLIQQRLKENQDGRFKNNSMHLFDYFPSNLVNCIKIVEETPTKSTDFEGYFILNNKDIKNNYFPIVVNSKYVHEDDVLSTLLLVHEITHVQQYIDTINDKRTNSCIDNEVEAFFATYRFFISVLNSKEVLLVFDRIDRVINEYQNPSLNKSDDIFDKELSMLSNIVILRRNAPCGEATFENLDQSYYDCVDAYTLSQLRKNIENDEYYKSQCGL